MRTLKFLIYIALFVCFFASLCQIAISSSANTGKIIEQQSNLIEDLKATPIEIDPLLDEGLLTEIFTHQIYLELLFIFILSLIIILLLCDFNFSVPISIIASLLLLFAVISRIYMTHDGLLIFFRNMPPLLSIYIDLKKYFLFFIKMLELAAVFIYLILPFLLSCLYIRPRVKRNKS